MGQGSKRLLIIGDARHGKDTVASAISFLTGMKWLSSSEFAMRKVIFYTLAERYGYKSGQECMADRVNHRKEWFDLITAYNSQEPARLAIELLQEADIYVGMRSRREVTRCREIRLFDAIIWVDASERLPPEDKSSNELSPADADFIIQNNQDEQALFAKVQNLCGLIA